MKDFLGVKRCVTVTQRNKEEGEGEEEEEESCPLHPPCFVPDAIHSSVTSELSECTVMHKPYSLETHDMNPITVLTC